jgi:hypothetical protein
MKISLQQLRETIYAAVAEAKKEKLRDVAPPNRQAGYRGHQALQLNKSQGSRSLYKRQGASNLGPYTSEAALRHFVRETIAEALAQPVLPESLRGAIARGKKSNRG